MENQIEPWKQESTDQKSPTKQFTIRSKLLSILFGKALPSRIFQLILLTIIGATYYFFNWSSDKFEVQDTYPTHSYVSTFMKAYKELYGGLPNEGSIVLYDTDKLAIDYSSAARQKWIRSSHDLLKTQSFVHHGSVTNWYMLFLSWVAFVSPHSEEYAMNQKIVSAAKFYAWLQKFLESEGEALLGSWTHT